MFFRHFQPYTYLLEFMNKYTNFFLNETIQANKRMEYGHHEQA
ncbi:hypothetical protein CHCC20375_3616 [Bacillus licheniformis]|nr:hypothetical protein CHCC20375_3616 [Bacillus licheniformis]